jgi:carboxymethylenebutenolidase
MGKDVTIEVHPGGHGFMNEENPIGTHDAQLAARLWPRAVAFLQESLR